MTPQHKTLTPRGVAAILARGIRANFAPEYWVSETDKLVELLLDLAMARGAEAENPSARSWLNPDRDVADRDTQWLDALAGVLASTTLPPKPQR